MARGAGHRIVTAVMDVCSARSIPKPDRIARSSLGQQTQNLLDGGYDERDVRETALELALRFTLYDRHKALMSLQQVVQQRYEDQRYNEHEALREGDHVIDHDVLAAMGAPLKALTGAHSPYDPTWRQRCAVESCPRTALFGRGRCGAHEPENEIRGPERHGPRIDAPAE